MNSTFCTACNEEKDIVNSVNGESGATHLLSCGHRFIEITLNDEVKVSEEIQLRKIGETNEKYRRGDKLPNINYAKKFIDYGDIDYEAASILFNIQNRDYDFMKQAAFLSAQAVEKY